ncbi:MAG TPA: DNA-directed RNA polymerase subunit omega [Egibacteraceae bacterium]|nr:DNA-directed RNA polymerase subunit omega [Egibacteraceae bacterium]
MATIDELLSKVDSKYTLVHLAARRAREINAYYHSLGEGLGQYTPPLVDEGSNKPLSIALEEIAAEKIIPQYASDARQAAEELFGSEEDAEVVALAGESQPDDSAADEDAVDDVEGS